MQPLGGLQAHVLYRAVLLAAGLIVLGLLFQELVTLLVAVLITVLISIPVAATATWLERYRIPRPVGALVALLIGVGAVAGVLALVLPTFIDQMDQFIDEVPEIATDLEQEWGTWSAPSRARWATRSRSGWRGWATIPSSWWAR